MTKKCECKIKDFGRNSMVALDNRIIYCPLHAAAPRMLNTLMLVADWFYDNGFPEKCNWVNDTIATAAEKGEK